MNNTNITNAALSTIATSLVALGATTIEHDLLSGVVEIVLGLAVFLVYEVVPTK